MDDIKDRVIVQQAIQIEEMRIRINKLLENNADLANKLEGWSNG